MDRFFSLFGKVTIATVALIIILGAGYYIGTHKNELGINPTPTIPITQTNTTPSITSVTTTPISTAPSITIVSSGSTTPYIVAVPQGWTQSHEQQKDIQLDKLTLTKNGYTLSIYQAPMGGGVCLYQGDPAFQGPSQTFNNFIPITGTPSSLRRSWNNEPQNTNQIYVVCEKGQDLYQTITSFGSISYETPKNGDETMLAEMDAIIATLKKQ